jgi:hypothetical protein
MCKLKIKMHSSEFWARVYDLPLKLRSDAMAKLLGNVIGNFVDVDAKDVNRLGKFLRVKVTIDLRQPLKRGTIVKYQGKSLRVYFKYERLPTFCYACGKIGHQIKDCDTVEGEDDADFEDIEEKDLPFGPWLRASPLPKLSGEVKKEQSSSSCSKSLFAEGSSSKGLTPESKGKEIEVVQPGTELGDQGAPVEEKDKADRSHSEIESVAESLGNVAINAPPLTNLDMGSHTKKKSNSKNSTKPPKKWSRNKGGRSLKAKKSLVAELGKRQLVEVEISVGDPMDLCSGEKRRRNKGEGSNFATLMPGRVLEDQHRPQ